MKDVVVFVDAETRDAEIRRFAIELIRGAWADRAEIDELIRRIAKNWDLRRMAAIDRNVLRLGVHELRASAAGASGGTPFKVVINEAIDLGKRYSTQNSGAFINGILDRAKELLLASQPAEAAKAEDGAASGG
jgi:N utilization substance protein B